MLKIDDNLLQSVGLGSLPATEKNRMLQHIYETLEMRVGMRLANGMSEDQLKDFEQLMPRQGDSPELMKQKEVEAMKWLEANFPNYRQVVAEELEKLKDEITAAAPQILESLQQQPPSLNRKPDPQAPYGQQPSASNGQTGTAQQDQAWQQPPTDQSTGQQ